MSHELVGLHRAPFRLLPRGPVWYIQVGQFLQAAREDGVGRYAVGAMERVLRASEEAAEAIKSSTTR